MQLNDDQFYLPKFAIVQPVKFPQNNFQNKASPTHAWKRLPVSEPMKASSEKKKLFELRIG